MGRFFLPHSAGRRYRPRIWKLQGRDNKFKQWSEYGSFHNIADAARRILELESDPDRALFFRLYVDPNSLTGQTADAEILSRLEYQSERAFYMVKRTVS